MDSPTTKRTRPSLARAKVEINLRRFCVRMANRMIFGSVVAFEAMLVFCSSFEKVGNMPATCRRSERREAVVEDRAAAVTIMAKDRKAETGAEHTMEGSGIGSGPDKICWLKNIKPEQLDDPVEVGSNRNGYGLGKTCSTEAEQDNMHDGLEGDGPVVEDQTHTFHF